MEIDVDDNVTAFMLMEYETLRDFYTRAIQGGEARVNFYFVTVSGLVGGLLLVYQITEIVSIELAVFVLLYIFFLGVMTYRRMITRSLVIAKYSRAMLRIRKYFVLQAPDIRHYLVLPYSEETEPYIQKGNFVTGGSGLRGFIAALNSALLASLGLLLVPPVSNAQENLPQQFLLGLFFFLVSFAAHEAIANRIFKRRELQVKNTPI